MSIQKTKMLAEAQKLSPMERAELIEGLLESFDNEHRKKIDEQWAKEVESRIEAYDAGKVEDIPISKVFEDIERGDLQ
jgi:putative addiction module component (TIGR02574 family)